MTINLPRASFASLLVEMKKKWQVSRDSDGIHRRAGHYALPGYESARRPGGATERLANLAHGVDGSATRCGTIRAVDAPRGKLYTEGVPRWYEHPDRPLEVDVAILPLLNDTGIDVYCYDPWASNRTLSAQLSEPLNIIGFPFGVTSGGALGIWVRGFIATDIALDSDDRPCFLVDSRTRSGQSGSPVIAFSPAGAATHVASGGLATLAHDLEEFFGVYSGRINEKSDLGIVWKAKVVCDIIDGKKQAIL